MTLLPSGLGLGTISSGGGNTSVTQLASHPGTNHGPTSARGVGALPDASTTSPPTSGAPSRPAREGNDHGPHSLQTVCDTPPVDYDVVGVAAGVVGSDSPYSVNVGAYAYGGEAPYSFAWSFGATTETALYEYSWSGPQYVSVTATDCDGESGTTSFWFWGFEYGAFWVPPISTEAITGVRGSPHLSPVTAPPPQANGTFLVGEELSFNATAQSTNSTVSSTTLEYHWTFGDGSSMVGSQGAVNHTYTAPGAYTVTLNVTASGGFWSSTSVAVIVSTQAPPLQVLASASYDPGPYPLSVNFSTGGTTGGDPPYSYFWEFGNGSTSASESPIHVYASPGTYMVSLEVTDSSGNTSYSNLTLSFQRYFAVTFMETGLPPGGGWSMAVNGVTQSSSSSAIQFEEANGTNPYSVGAVPGYTATPASGYVSVAGMAVNEVIRFASTSVNLASIPIPVGLYPEFAGYDPGNGYMYVTNIESNSTSILNGTKVVATVPVGDSPAYAIYDPANGYEYVTNEGSYSPTGSVSVLNGTRLVGTALVGVSPFSEAYDAADGYVYVPNFESGDVSVLSGTTVVATVSVGPYPSFAAYDAGNGYVYVPNEGTGTNSSVSVLSGTTVVATVPVGIYPYFALYDPSNGYVYVLNYNSTGVSILNGTSVVATVPIGVGATWAVVDAQSGEVYVEHQTSDDVNVLNGTTVVATIPVGLYPYAAAYDSSNRMVYVTNSGSNTVSVVNGTTVVATVAVGSSPAFDGYDPANGYVYVPDSASDWVSVLRAPTRYAASFAESGLPGGTQWSVTLNGITQSSSTNSMVFSVPNGTYAYSIGAIAGYSVTYHGQVTVNGAPISEAIAFTRVAYAVTFAESGLPSGTNWSVTLNGTSRSSTASSIGFTEANGTYSFSVGAVSGYTASPASGSVTVNGAPETEAITFSAVPPSEYTVAFTETGLPSGTSWSVTFNGSTQSSTGSTILFTEANGTYAYALGTVSGYTVGPATGSVTVSGSDVSRAITFTPISPGTYTVTFTESGLPTGTGWSVTLAGVSKTSTTTTITFREPNGTYPFSVGPVSGYTSTPSAGSLSVSGAPVSEALTFSPSSSSTSSGFLGLSGNTGYYLLGGIAILAVAGAAVALALRSRRK